MVLTSGTRLGPYEIQASLGAGGMGEVYRAHDSKLGRDVAVKVLPETLAAGRSSGRAAAAGGQARDSRSSRQRFTIGAVGALGGALAGSPASVRGLGQLLRNE